MIKNEAQAIPGLELQIPETIESLQLPNISLLNYYRLKEDRIFYIDFEIDGTILDIQEEIILINQYDDNNDIPVEKRTPIRIYINSPGGLLTETLSLCQTMLISKTPIYTYNIGIAYSAAFLLLLAGHKRFAFPFCEAMAHTGSGGTSGTYEQTVEQGKSYKRMIDFTGKYILDRTNIDPKVFGKNKSKDWYFPTDDQIKYGIVHEIVTNWDQLVK